VNQPTTKCRAHAKTTAITDNTRRSPLQEQLKLHPQLLPLDELGLVGPAVVVGRESSLESGKVDLVLLGNGGELALIEFKTGPQNTDFRACLAQLLDYGSDLWGMSLEEFQTRVAEGYFKSPHCPSGSVPTGASLDQVVTKAWVQESTTPSTGETGCRRNSATAHSTTSWSLSGSLRRCSARCGT